MLSSSRQCLKTQRGTPVAERQSTKQKPNMPAHDCLLYCPSRSTPCQRHTWCSVVTKYPLPRCHVAVRRTHDTPAADVWSTRRDVAFHRAYNEAQLNACIACCGPTHCEPLSVTRTMPHPMTALLRPIATSHVLLFSHRKHQIHLAVMTTVFTNISLRPLLRDTRHVCFTTRRSRTIVFRRPGMIIVHIAIRRPDC